MIFLVRRTRFRTGGNQNRLRQRRPAQKLRAIFGEFGSQVGTPLRAMTEHRYPPRFHGNFFVPFCAVEFFGAVWNPSRNDRNLLASNGFSSDCLKRVRNASESPAEGGLTL